MTEGVTRRWEDKVFRTLSLPPPLSIHNEALRQMGLEWGRLQCADTLRMADVKMQGPRIPAGLAALVAEA